jgi:hypothetical protein
VLEWEAVVWTLYLRICTQWRHKSSTQYTAQGNPITNDVQCGLDYNPAIALMNCWGWDIDMGLELLQVIEIETMNPSKAQD